MSIWSEEIEEELILLIKDWLKQQGRSQADLQKGLGAESSRMNALIAVIKKDYQEGGITKSVEHLCDVENAWASNKEISSETSQLESTYNVEINPFDQLDLLLQELDEDSN